jgi:protein-tyrosine phosphatase
VTQVLFVCLGNICRSPMAEAIFQAKLEKQNLLTELNCDSAGTANYHPGKAPDHRTLQVLQNNGIYTQHRARQILSDDISAFEYLIAMDDSNYNHLKRMQANHPPRKGQLLRMIDFLSPEQNPVSYTEIPDPYYGDIRDFESVFALLEPACDTLLRHIQSGNKTTANYERG